MLTQNALPRPISAVHAQQYGIALNETYTDETGAVYIFLKGVASTIIGSWVSYDETGLTTLLVKTEADKLKPLAIALSANNAATTFGWYQIFGEVAAMGALASGTKETALYSSATAGFTDIVSTSQTKINRAIYRANRAASNGNTTGYIAYPSAA